MITRVNKASEPISTHLHDLPHRGSGKSLRGSPYIAHLLLICIFIIIARHTLLPRLRSISDLAVVDTFAALDIAAVGLAALVLIFSGSLGRTWSRLSRTAVVWLGAYYLFCALSSMWSIMPLFSFYRSLEYIILMFAALTAVAQYKDFGEAEQAFCRVAMVTIILQMSIILRMYGFSWSLTHWHTTSYSISSVILFCYCFGEYLAMSKEDRSEAQERAKRLRRFSILSFCTLALGTSSASNIAATMGCLLIFLALRRFWLLMIGVWVAVLLFLWGGGGEIIYTVLFPGKSAANIMTGSGRTFLWEFLWEKFLERPILGYGFGLVGIIGGGMATHAHNSFFPVLIGTGLVGVLLFVLFAGQLWWVTLSNVWRRGPGIVGFAGALAAAFVNALSLNVMADRWITSSVVFIFLLGLFFLHIRNHENFPSEQRGLQKQSAGRETDRP